jgi:hypothetical protein
MGNDHEVEFHEIQTAIFHEIKIMIMSSKLYLFMRSKLTIIFHNFDQEVETWIMRSKFANNAFLSFSLMIDLLAASGIMRSKQFKFI